MTGIVNLLLYQLGWFACVLGTAWGRQWVGVSIAVALAGTHFYLAKDRVLQTKLVIAAALIGLVVDTGLLWAGVYRFPQGAVIDGLPPPFMTLLWIQFATTFRYSMRWLSGRYTLSFLFGLLGAPLAFYAGESLGAIMFLSPRLAHYGVLAVGWSVSVPLLVFISDQLADRAGENAQYRWLGANEASTGEASTVFKLHAFGNVE
jgi:hypothetical protein